MAKIKVDLTKEKGRIKPMHGGGQPPLAGFRKQPYFHYLTEAGIPYSRLHDVGGDFGGGKYVDVPNIFRDFDADENNPESYDFTFTDYLLEELVQAKVEPYFRLGITIENWWNIKTYRTQPPKDFSKWARICEHIIAHYTKGWANGFNYNIRYWEIWNEPEGEALWGGTAEQFYELYDVSAKHLKKCFPEIMVGGYSSWGFRAIFNPDKENGTGFEAECLRFFLDFLKYIKEHGSPLDFFSWHSYFKTKRTIEMDEYIHEKLVEFGYGDAEIHLNEWNPCFNKYGTAHHSAEIAGTMIAMQNGFEDVMCIYDMRINTAPYCPLFDIKTKKPIHGYYAFVAFNELYKLGTQVECVCDTDELYVLAASDGKKNAMLISNLTEEEQNLEFEGVDFTDARFYTIDDERLLSWSPNAEKIGNNSVILIQW